MNRKDTNNYKTLWVHKDTHKEIASYGTKDETYDDIVKKILKVYKKYHAVYEKENEEKIK